MESSLPCVVFAKSGGFDPRKEDVALRCHLEVGAKEAKIQIPIPNIDRSISKDRVVIHRSFASVSSFVDACIGIACTKA